MKCGGVLYWTVFMYFWPLYEGATQYRCCQNRRKISGDRNAQKAFHSKAAGQVGRGGLGGDFKNIIALLPWTLLPLICVSVFVYLCILLLGQFKKIIHLYLRIFCCLSFDFVLLYYNNHILNKLTSSVDAILISEIWWNYPLIDWLTHPPTDQGRC